MPRPLGIFDALIRTSYPFPLTCKDRVKPENAHDDANWRFPEICLSVEKEIMSLEPENAFAVRENTMDISLSRTDE